MGLYLAVAHVAVRGSTFYQRITSPAAQCRFESLDGLRGFLALGVFFHHAVATHTAYVAGHWTVPRGFYELLGPGSVAFFFMITGFLFWSKAIHNGARIEAIKLWKNRLLRIAPMCLFSVLVMFLIAAIQSRFRLREPVGELIAHVLGCCSLGVWLPNVNGVELGRFNANVFWTLRYEWCFYMAIPLLAWFATAKRLAGLCAVAVPLGLMAASHRSIFGFYFLMGMITAQFVASDVLGPRFRCTMWPLLSISLLSAFAATHGTTPWSRCALMFVGFLAIAHDCRLFAFLRWPAARFIGTISYSVYLMHGIVLFVVFGAVNQVSPVERLTPCGFWSVACCCGLLTVAVSAITYRFVEHPFLSARRFVSRQSMV